MSNCQCEKCECGGKKKGPIKASELVKMLNDHIEKYGDGNVLILDGYSVTYKTLSTRLISRTYGNIFTIECESEEL